MISKDNKKKGEGIHDMGVGMESDPAKFGTHTIISTAKGKVSFSSRNYGNFLLAVAYGVMTDGMIDGEDTKILADLYEMAYGEDWEDSRDDQKAIELGGMNYEDHYSTVGNTGKYNKRSSDKNYSDEFLKWYYDEDDEDDEDDENEKPDEINSISDDIFLLYFLYRRKDQKGHARNFFST